MADITWPSSGRAFVMARQDEGIAWDVELTKSRSGKITTFGLPGARWTCSVHVPGDTVAYLTERRQLEALKLTLRGGANRLLLWNLLTPAPLGTMRGSPTVNGAVAVNATTLAITGVPGTTLLRGDRISVAGQRVILTADATLNGSINFLPPLRAAVTSGTAVVWDKPTTRYVLTDAQDVFPVDGTQLPGFSFDLVEE